MRRFFLIVATLTSFIGLSAPLHAGDHEPRWRPRQERGEYARERGREGGRDLSREAIDQERVAERRERMRALREEMLRTQPRPQPYRDEDFQREFQRGPGERRDFARPPPSRETESLRRLSPEERRQFRRQIQDAGRDVYRGQ